MSGADVWVSGISLNPYSPPVEPRHNSGRRTSLQEEPLSGVRRVLAGQEWGAVTVLAMDGRRALDRLGTGIGPVLASTYTGRWTFFIDTGSLEEWTLRGARLLRKNTVVEVPLTREVDGGRDIRWVVAPGGTTDAARLFQALSGEAPSPPDITWSTKPQRVGGARRRKAAKAGSPAAPTDTTSAREAAKEA